MGFPGTMGADFIDYLVTDRCVSPPSLAWVYQEKLLCMPHSYCPLRPQPPPRVLFQSLHRRPACTCGLCDENRRALALAASAPRPPCTLAAFVT
eukprot:2810839-Prymnesium_polylepis.1